MGARGVGDLLGLEAQHDVHQIGGHGIHGSAGAQQDHVGDGGGQRQQQGEASAGARLVVEQHATAQGVDFGAHHVKADAAASDGGGALGAAEVRAEDQLREFVFR